MSLLSCYIFLEVVSQWLIFLSHLSISLICAQALSLRVVCAIAGMLIFSFSIVTGEAVAAEEPQPDEPPSETAGEQSAEGENENGAGSPPLFLLKICQSNGDQKTNKKSEPPKNPVIY